MSNPDMSARDIDPFTREVITNGLRSAAEEMFIALGRTAKSSVIYETLDYACGLIDTEANVIAQANGVPGFLGALKFCVADVIDKFGLAGLAPGDVILLNDYHGGTHLNDVAMVAPVFAEDEPILFTASKAHWTDVGGKDPGSWTTDSTSVFQEGIQFPLVKLYDGGDLNRDVRDIIAANTRMPEMTLGDMQAQEASMDVAADRVTDLIERYGAQTVLNAIDAYLTYGRELVREEVAALPNGTYSATDAIDDDGITDDPIHVEVEVTITDTAVRLDYSGTDAVTEGPINAPYAATVSELRAFFQAITLPHADTNEGFFAPLELVIPEGTVLNATKPAPIATNWEASAMAADVAWQALGPHIPDRLSAGHFLSVCATIVGGQDSRTGDDFLLVEPQPGGWGGSSGQDGADVLVCSGDGDTLAMPVEVIESRFPILVDQYRLNTPQEAGHGEYRGGTGLVQDYRIINESGAFLTASFGRSKYPPWGMAGGNDGNGNHVEIMKREGGTDRYGKVTTYTLEDDDVIRLVTSAGGGYGDPFDRDPDRVVEDYRNGYITAKIARDIYGVVIDEDANAVDKDATECLRSNNG